jgi:hypothetical protein
MPQPPTQFVAYHGSASMAQPTVFREFRNMDFGPGFYMATDPYDALGYGHCVHEAVVRLQSPIVLSMDTPVAPELQQWLQRVMGIDDENLEFYEHPTVGVFELAKTLVEMRLISTAKLVAALQRMGFDGIYIESAVVTSTHPTMTPRGDYIALWSPSQILSWTRVCLTENT